MTFYSYEIGELFDGTGTAESSAASKAVVGTASSFDTEFATGYLIIIAGETRVVDAVADATHLTVTENFTTGSGSAVAYTGANLINLEELSTPLEGPKSNFREFSQVITLGNGLPRGLGWSQGSWRWGFLTGNQRDQMRLFCDDASNNPLAGNEVYIRTRNNENSDEYFYATAILVWGTGQEEKVSRGIRAGFTINFTDVTEIVIS